MGCDIHGYIEYNAFTTREGAPYYSLFAEGVRERDYAMFGILANVRRTGCIYPPRGIPQNTCMSIKWEYFLFVGNEDGEGTVSQETAARWVKDGIAEYVGENQITHPDWHHASWLTAEELENCLRAREAIQDYGTPDPIWKATLAAMKELPDARFVFWFDN